MILDILMRKIFLIQMSFNHFFIHDHDRIDCFILSIKAQVLHLILDLENSEEC